MISSTEECISLSKINQNLDTVIILHPILTTNEASPVHQENIYPTMLMRAVSVNHFNFSAVDVGALTSDYNFDLYWCNYLSIPYTLGWLTYFPTAKWAHDLCPGEWYYIPASAIIKCVIIPKSTLVFHMIRY